MSFDWTSQKVETRESMISAKGTFAKTEIKEGELIAAWGGYVKTYEDWDIYPESMQSLDNTLQVHDNILIGSVFSKDIGDGYYTNHSCEPNAGIKGQILLVAMKDIQKDEEITFDYGTTLFGINFKMICKCGKQTCRKIITSDDWKIPEMQKRYDGWFSYYLERKIKESKNMS